MNLEWLLGNCLTVKVFEDYEKYLKEFKYSDFYRSFCEILRRRIVKVLKEKLSILSFKGLPGYNCVKLYSKVLIDKYFLKNFSNSSLRLTT